MLLVIGAPIAIWAQSDDMEISKEETMMQVEEEGWVRIKKSHLTQVITQLDRLQEGLRQLQENGRPTETVTPLRDGARADCLNECREDLAVCLEQDMTISSDEDLHPCLAGSSACISVCNERPPELVSCKDRCAVSLGGCLEKITAPKEIALEDEAMAFVQCHNWNRECLVAACKLEDPERLPEEYCTDQCDRMMQICQGGRTQYDKQASHQCQVMHEGCMERLCGGDGEKKTNPPIRIENKDSMDASEGY